MNPAYKAAFENGGGINWSGVGNDLGDIGFGVLLGVIGGPAAASGLSKVINPRSAKAAVDFADTGVSLSTATVETHVGLLKSGGC